MNIEANNKSIHSNQWLGGLGRLRVAHILQFAIVSFVFGIAYNQEPIYFSSGNQNTKYLQGLAQSGYGLLSEDWTANTIDPLPAFTALVRFTYQFIHPEYGFYFLYFIIFGLYVYSIVAIVSEFFPIRPYPARLLLFLALLLIVHTVNVEILDFDLGKHLQYGVASQFILGPVFQPCNFGVFLLISIYAFLKERPYLSVLCLAIAGTFHPAYFPSVAALTLSYMGILLWQERHWRKPLFVGIVSGILIFPVFAYMYFTFQATTPELTQQAADIIVNQRIPHHSIPSEWLDGEALGQTAIVAIALILMRRTQLFYILIGPFLAAVLLTILQMFIENDFLAFIAPWRISVFLVPLTTAMLLAMLVSGLFTWIPNWTRQRSVFVSRMSIAIIASLFILGSITQVEKFQKSDDTFAMMNFVQSTKQSGDTYLLPVGMKELRKFRLYTGAPIFINRKTHPYKDTEVIEWNHRLELVDQFYDAQDRENCKFLRRELEEYSITHVVLPAENFRGRCKRLTERYRDKHYGVFSTENL